MTSGPAHGLRLALLPVGGGPHAGEAVGGRAGPLRPARRRPPPPGAAARHRLFLAATDSSLLPPQDARPYYLTERVLAVVYGAAPAAAAAGAWWLAHRRCRRVAGRGRSAAASIRACPACALALRLPCRGGPGILEQELPPNVLVGKVRSCCRCHVGAGRWPPPGRRRRSPLERPPTPLPERCRPRRLPPPAGHAATRPSCRRRRRRSGRGATAPAACSSATCRPRGATSRRARSPARPACWPTGCRRRCCRCGPAVGAKATAAGSTRLRQRLCQPPAADCRLLCWRPAPTTGAAAPPAACRRMRCLTTPRLSCL